MRWLPDTCQCTIDLDRQGKFEKAVTKCTAHKDVADADLFATCQAESGTAALVNEAIQAASPGLLFKGGWDEQRNAVLDAPTLTDKEKEKLTAAILSHLSVRVAHMKARVPGVRFL